MRTVLTTIALVTTFLTAPGCGRPPVGLHEFTTHQQIKYAERAGGPLYLDIAVPTGTEHPRPAVLWIHGGGWAGGRRTIMRQMTEFIASLGYVSATADYRLTPSGAAFPDPLQDAAAAVRFLRKNAKTYNIDPDRIAIGGDSAGGHLALLVGLIREPELLGDEPFPDVSSKVSAIIDIYGPTDLAALYKGGGWPVRWLLVKLLRCTPREKPDLWARASPVTHVHAGAPPTLILHGERDTIVPYEQAERLRQRCEELNAPCYLGRVRAAGHGWMLYPRSRVYAGTLPLITHFLARVFPEPMR